LRQFLRDWLPQQYDVTNGYVINRRREISRQCDVIFYNPLVCPKFILDKAADRRLVPLADTYGTIEVKSTLDEKELDDALEKIESVDNLLFFDKSMYAFPAEYDEYEVQAVEIEKDDPYSFPSRHKQSYIPNDQWRTFRVKMEKEKPKRTSPFSMIFAYKLAANLTLEKIEESLRKRKHVPNAIIVLDTGFLMRFSKEAMKRYKSLKDGKPIDEYYFDSEIFSAYIERSDPSASKYIVEQPTSQRETLLFFYSFLLDLLNDQQLPSYVHTDLVAVWRKKDS
jgi:hypothetical protein